MRGKPSTRAVGSEVAGSLSFLASKHVTVLDNKEKHSPDASRCSLITTEPHGTRLWFREPNSVSVFDPDKTRLYATGVIVGEIEYDDNERIATCRFTEVR